MECSSPRPWSVADIGTLEQLRDAAAAGRIPELCSCRDAISTIGHLVEKFGALEVEYAAKIACACAPKCEPPRMKPPETPTPPPPPQKEEPGATCWADPPPPRQYQGENNGY